MSVIQKVIVAGAGNNLGPHILSALHASNFTIAVLTRAQSTTTFPSYVTVIPSDYTPSSLVSAFKGQDAVVSAIGVTGIAAQIPLIDAAEKAGVKRFIPSEFGWAKDRPMLPELLMRLEPKERVFDHLVETCKGSKTMSWSALATGPFFDWALTKSPVLGFMLPQYTARIYDSGDEPITTTTGAAIGTAVAGILVHSEQSANRFLKIRSFRTSQNEILAALDDVTGRKWDVKRFSTKEIAEGRKQKLAEKRFMDAFVDLLAVQLFEDGMGRGNITELEESDNVLLGVDEADLREVIKKIVRTLPH